MLKSMHIVTIFITTAFISMQGVAHTNTITTTITQHHIEIKEKPSFLQKLKAFVNENKPLVAGVFVLSILAMYLNRAPLFIEWTLMNLMLHVLDK